MKIYDTKLRCSRTGFTLLEILLGGVILAVISMNVYRGFENFSRAGVRAQDRMIAMSLTNTLFEQIKRDVDAQPNLFDQITTLSTDWVAIDVPNYPQGYYENRITARPNTPHAGIAQVVVEIRWQDQSGIMAERARNVFTMAEPGQFVFGNITGTVYNCQDPDNHIPIADATVRVHQAPPGLEWIIGTVTQTNAHGNYSFRGQDNRNILPIGDGYRLMGVSPGMRSMVLPGQNDPGINLPEVPDIEQDFCLYEDKVYITGRLVRSDTQAGISGKDVSLRRAENLIRHETTNNQGRFQFILTEEDGMQDLEPGEIRCFTVATGGPFSGAELQRSFPYWHAYANRPSFVGDFCHPDNPTSHDRRGWSSAVMGNNPLNPICDGNRPWFGNPSSESSDIERSICVSIGTNHDIGDIPLKALPNESVTINVTVDAPDGTQLCTNQGFIEISWGSSLGAERYRTRWRDISDENTFSTTTLIPPIHLFAQATGNRRMRVRAYTSQRIPGCCGQNTCHGRWANFVPIDLPGPISLTINLVPGAGQLCGGAYGIVESLLPDVRSITSGTVTCGVSANFSSNGKWRIQCSDGTLDRVTRGQRNIRFTHSGFYERQGTGSNYWPYRSAPRMNIQGGGNFTKHPPGDNRGYVIGLYPIGYGHITGRVLNHEDGSPVPGATVVFRRYGSTNNGSATTNAQGEFTLSDRIESWPPGGSLNNIPENVRGQMIGTAQVHSLRVTATVDGQTQTVTIPGIYVNAGETTPVEDIQILFPSGQQGGDI